MIRKGRLVAETSLDEFTGTGAGRLRVRGTDSDRAGGAGWPARGASVESDGDDALRVEGISAEEIGAIALGSGIALHELAPVRSSLEERFLEVTGEEGLE